MGEILLAGVSSLVLRPCDIGARSTPRGGLELETKVFILDSITSNINEWPR